MQPREVLGVGPGASPDEVRAAFRRFAVAHHPDQGGDRARFQAGLDAYRQLAGGPGKGTGTDPATTPANVVFHRRRRGLRLLSARVSRRSRARRRVL